MIKGVSVQVAAEDTAWPREGIEPTGLLQANLQVVLPFPFRTQTDSQAFPLEKRWLSVILRCRKQGWSRVSNQFPFLRMELVVRPPGVGQDCVGVLACKVGMSSAYNFS